MYTYHIGTKSIISQIGGKIPAKTNNELGKLTQFGMQIFTPVRKP